VSELIPPDDIEKASVLIRKSRDNGYAGLNNDEVDYLESLSKQYRGSYPSLVNKIACESRNEPAGEATEPVEVIISKLEMLRDNFGPLSVDHDAIHIVNLAITLLRTHAVIDKDLLETIDRIIRNSDGIMYHKITEELTRIKEAA